MSPIDANPDVGPKNRVWIAASGPVRSIFRSNRIASGVERSRGTARPHARPRLLLGVTADESIGLVRGFSRYLTEAGWQVHVVTSPGPRSAELSEDRTVWVHLINMKRDLAPVDDLVALGHWVRLLIRLRPDLVCIGTPKAGLIGGLAALITRVPHRIYLLRGLRSEGLVGLSGTLVRLAERISANCAQSVLCVSSSLRTAAIRARVVAGPSAVVLGSGSSNGVSSDISPTAEPNRVDARRSWFEHPERFTLGFAGRVTSDKGLDILAAALTRLSKAGVVGNCLIIGGDDSSESAQLRSGLDRSGWAVAHTGHVGDAVDKLSMVDALCLPSRREGFPNVVLEAAMLRLPTIGSDATGMVDAVIDEVTGLTFPTTDSQALATAIGRLNSDTGLRDRLGTQARERAIREFSREAVWAKYESYFRCVIGEDPRP